MELTDSLKTLLSETAKALKGSARRLCMARTVKERGPGGQQRAARALRWGRMTIRTGLHALDSGMICVDAFALRGRKRAEAHLPNLLTDIQAIVDRQSQAAPQFRSNRLSTRLTAAEVRRQLIAPQGYAATVLPPAETIGTKLHELGSDPQKVAKSQPQKNFQKRTLSSTTSAWFLAGPRRRRPCDASRWMPKRALQSVRLRGVASAASRPSPLPTTCTQPPLCPQWASSCQRSMHCFCMALPPKCPVPVWSLGWGGGGKWCRTGLPPSRP